MWSQTSFVTKKTCCIHDRVQNIVAIHCRGRQSRAFLLFRFSGSVVRSLPCVPLPLIVASCAHVAERRNIRNGGSSALSLAISKVPRLVCASKRQLGTRGQGDFRRFPVADRQMDGQI